jgi:hypothetical protein
MSRGWVMVEPQLSHNGFPMDDGCWGRHISYGLWDGWIDGIQLQLLEGISSLSHKLWVIDLSSWAHELVGFTLDTWKEKLSAIHPESALAVSTCAANNKMRHPLAIGGSSISKLHKQPSFMSHNIPSSNHTPQRHYTNSSKALLQKQNITCAMK